jgi:ubiquinone/menaquinone biosynthesis C-methylase UbiE
VRTGDRVLDVGAGPGRFTIELAEIGADITVADISPRQLELNRERVAEAQLEQRVVDRVVADVTDLSCFSDGEFDATVCYGGPISYVVERAEEGIAELARVTKPGGYVLLSVMSLVGTFMHAVDEVVELVQHDGVEMTEDVVRTGVLPEAEGWGHLPMRLFRWRELEELLAPHGEIVAASAAGLLKAPDPDDAALRDLLTRLELDLGAEQGAIDGGEHMLAVLRVPAA